MNSLFKRSMAMLLVIIMVIAIVPITAAADSGKLSLTVGEDGSISISGSTVTIDPDSGSTTSITADKILDSIPEGYTVNLAGQTTISNTPGSSGNVNVIVLKDGGMVESFPVTVSINLSYADYTIDVSLFGSDGSTINTSYSSTSSSTKWEVELKKDVTYTYYASVTPTTDGSPMMNITPASGDFSDSVSFTVEFASESSNYKIAKQAPALTKKVVTPSIKINGEEVDSSNSVVVTSSTLKFYPFETATITMDEGCGYTNVSVASSGEGEASISNNKLTYYIKLGGKTSQSVTLKFTGSGVADKTVTVTFTGLTIKPSVTGATLTGNGISTSANGSTKDKALPVNKQGYFNVGSLVDYYSYMSTTQKSAISFSISKVTDDFGEFTTSASGSKLKDSTTINGGTNIYYKAEKASKTDYDYIDIKVSVTGVSTDQTATTKIYTGGTAGYDFDDYNSKTDVVKYVAKTSSDTYKSATAFTIADFGKYLESYKESDYEDYYIMIDDEDDILLGTLYLGTSSSKGSEVDEDDKITLDDIDKGYFRYCHTEEGVDQFTFTVYNKKGSSVSGSKNKTMWLVDDKSLIYGDYPILRDITVATYEDEEYDDFDDDFEDAFIDDDSMTYVKITSLPSQGTLYNGTKKVSSGDTIKASSLYNLSYEPDSNAKDTDDDPDYFTWNATNGDNYAINDAKVYIHYFEDEDDYEDSLIAGDFTVYYTDTEVDIKTEYFDCAFAGDDDLDKVIITELPSKGYLYDGSTKISKKDYEIDYDDLDDLVYKTSKSSATDDDFKYIVLGDYLDDERDCVYEGTVDITVYDEEETKVDGKWTNQTTTSPTYTVSNLKSSSGLISYTADSKVVENFLSTCKSGSELTIVLSGDSSTTGRSLTIDNSFFTATNVTKIPYITLSEGTSGAKLKIDTNTVKTYIGSGNSNFTITLKSSSISTSAREVSLKIGTTSISFPGASDAVLSIPYSKSSSTNADTVVMASTSGSSSTALVSSEYASSAVKADIPGSGTYAVATSSKTFSDTAENWAWTRGYIPSLTARGVVNGYTDGTYLPNKSVTRAEFIKLLVTSLGLEDSSAVCPFADVKQDANWASAYIGAAIQAGIVTETSGNFNPNQAITRADMALWSYRAANAAGLTLPTTGSVTTFTDQSSISSTYLSAVQAMQKAGIINGELDGSFNPNGDTVRAAAAKIIWFLCAYYYGWSTSGRS